MITRVETETPHPDTLAGKIDAKIWRSPYVLRSNDRQIVFLEAPIDTIGFSRELSTPFNKGMPRYPQERALVTLVSALSYRAIKITVSPKNIKSSSSTWRIDVAGNQDPKIEFRRKLETTPIPYDPEFNEPLMAVIDNSVSVEKNIDDYTEGFLLRIHGKWNKDQTRQGLNALMMTELHHLGQRRQSGEPYVDHPWETVRELIDGAGLVNEANMITAAWIHDVPEDGKRIKQPEIDPATGSAPVSHEKWAEETEAILVAIVGPKAAEYAMLMTRPQPDGVELFTKKEANGLYYVNLIKYPQVIMIKMADRLHNARTLWAMPEANQRATLISTVKTYYPIFELARDEYPEAVDYFMFELEKALRPIAEELGIDYDSL